MATNRVSLDKMVKNDLKNLAEDIIASYDMRARVVGEIVEDTHKTLDEFKEKREEMSENLREVLAKSESFRKKDFNAMMQDILLTQHTREENVKKMLADFREEEAQMATRLRDLLKQDKQLRLTDFKETIAHIRRDQTARETKTGEQIRVELAAMQGEVHKMLEDFKKEREAASSEWKKVPLLLAEKRSENL